MTQLRTVQLIARADEVALGHDTVKQALPIRNIDQMDPFLLLHHFNKTLNPEVRDWTWHLIRIAVSEPITFLFDGAIHHRDSRGNEGFLNGGDVQWMTAGMGIVHSEAAQKPWLENGGKMNLIQLWVNLPKKDKMIQPRYQDIKADSIPVVERKD